MGVSDPMNVAIMVTASEARELLRFLRRMQSGRLDDKDRMTTYWLENATSRALHARGLSEEVGRT